MLVGWAGNNGSTVTAMILANRKGLKWQSKEGLETSNYFGSLIMSSTVGIGNDSEGNEVYVPFSSIVPMAHPNEIVIGGWDINRVDLASAMDEAKVLDYDLKVQLYDEMKNMVPLPSVYSPTFIAENQRDRANNLIYGTKQEQIDQIRKDIASFKSKNNLDRVIVLWTATTERWSQRTFETEEELLDAIRENNEEVAPSTMFAIGSLLEGCPFINGSPQNTLIPGLVRMAERLDGFIGGDDFKSGQTKLKAVLTDFLIGSGIKPLAITSYNHLGNNDGRNLSAPLQFKSKEISKASLVDDLVKSNPLLYKKIDDKPDHTIVIKYVPAVGDSKRAMDEYYSEILMGGRNVISIHNTCEDSLLAGI
jgi:myo-inositol-1-phosphate synthase